MNCHMSWCSQTHCDDCRVLTANTESVQIIMKNHIVTFQCCFHLAGYMHSFTCSLCLSFIVTSHASPMSLNHVPNPNVLDLCIKGVWNKTYLNDVLHYEILFNLIS